MSGWDVRTFNVNANLMADGYAAAGLLGVAISAVVFSLTLETIRALSTRLDVRLVAIVMAGPMFSMFNSAAVQALGEAAVSWRSASS